MPEDVAPDVSRRAIESFFRADLTLVGISIAIHTFLAREPSLAKALPIWSIGFTSFAGGLFFWGGIMGALLLMHTAGQTLLDLSRTSIFSVTVWGLGMLALAFLVLNIHLYRQLLFQPTLTPMLPTLTPVPPTSTLVPLTPTPIP
jgi:glucose-6-phosphate-specific signal transduction histidine kinase